MSDALLTFDDLSSAFARVAENAGCAGVDGVTVDAFGRDREERLGQLLAEAREGQARPLPLLRILVEKTPGSKRTRTLLVPAVRDRVLQTAVARALSRSFEEEFLEASFAYRPGRGVDRAIARVRQLRDDGYWHVVDADIRGFFDRVPHGALLRRLAARVSRPWDDWVHAWVSAPAWDGTRLRRRTLGLPQGAPISPLLANLFLQPLDVALLAADGRLVRYADDFLVLARDPEAARGLLELTSRTLADLGLQLHPEKTRVTSFDEGFRFLGVLFQKDEIWRAWKEAPAARGRVVHMAAPMPAWRLAEFRQASGPSAMQEALTEAGLRPWRVPAVPSPTPLKDEPDVAFLYLTEQGSVLRKSGDRLLVEHEARIVLDIPYHKLEHVLLFGHVQVTTQALHELLDKGVDLSLFSRQGAYRGSLTPPRSGNVLDRLAQYGLWQDAPRALGWARAIVAGKAANAAATAAQWRRNSDVPGAEMDALLEEMQGLPGRAHGAASRDELLGVEGHAAKLHFRALALANRSAFPFPGRRKHPATDPLNALLSLAYTLLTHELASLVEAEGLDPCLGVLHEIDRSRPSLALDLVEAFRAPVADRLVVRLVNLGTIGAEQFAPPTEGQGVLLTPVGLRRFLAAHEEWMLADRDGAGSYRDALRGEVRRFLQAVRRKEGFAPWGDVAPAPARAASRPAATQGEAAGCASREAPLA